MGSHEAQAGEFSLTRGGPFYRLARATGLARGDARDVTRLSVAVWLVAWVPPVLIALAEWVVTRQRPGILLDLSVHARPLVVLPLFFIAEHSLDRRTRRTTRRIVDWRLVDDACLPELERLLARAARWRDAAWAEAVLCALAVAGSQIILWGLGPTLGLLSRRALGDRPAGAWLWYGFVSLPIFEFFMFRWGWRWLIWTRVLWGISRLDLRLVPTHPDRAGGLMTLQHPALGFAWVYMGLSAVLAANWLGRVLFDGARAQDYAQELTLFSLITVAATIGPLMAFTAPLWSVRLRGNAQYGRLALRYTRLFHHRWIERDGEEGLLGAPDIQSLADLGASYDVMASMQVVPFSRRMVLVVLLAVLVPMIPLLLTMMPLSELLRRMAGTFLGGAG